ncbi:hypothetical protein FRUB_08121 [Fimbriiglobus ruber]|uniref:Uncharacterized protein n=1 Tax=Fimbriiglobus ruber TaxID=1908690 RepID=A0A225DAI5_9BACT|nr:hypothetical protein FRUB_08121 [Fimbriiglobus ruber]
MQEARGTTGFGGMGDGPVVYFRRLEKGTLVLECDKIAR